MGGRESLGYTTINRYFVSTYQNKKKQKHFCKSEKNNPIFDNSLNGAM